MNLKLSKDDQGLGYLYLPNHPGAGNYGVVKKQLKLADVVSDYKGPDVYLDFNDANELIGIEIIS